jgi:3-oxoacyl-[acyl-carrier-protein] synthase-3
MRYRKTHVEALGYELAPVVVTSGEMEQRLLPLYEALHIAPGQIEALTGIVERRYWEEGVPVSRGALKAARNALAQSAVRADQLEMVVYAGVCRENFEPATAFAVASGLGVGAACEIYDVSNACLGVLNGIADIASRIELGQVRAGLVVSCETAREINEIAIERMLREKDMALFTKTLATLTGGSGAAAVLLTDGSFTSAPRRRLRAGITRSAPEHHGLCTWGLRETGPHQLQQVMQTDSVAVLKHGVALGKLTWKAFLEEAGWTAEAVDRVICHQVGASHRDQILATLGVPAEKDFSTYKFLGNIGTVSLPLTAALAEEREFLKPGDAVSLLGIGSGLTCMMLGVDW